MDFRTKEGEKANNWFTRSAYDAASGEDWVLEKDHADPRKRRWVKYDRNGKVVNRKTGALNIGGNLTQWGKGGLKNVGNTVNAAGKLASAFDIRDRVASEGVETTEEPPAPSGMSFQQALGYEPKGEMKSMFEAYFNDLDTGFFSDQDETAYMSLKDIYGIVNQQQLTEDNQTFTNTPEPDPETYTTWDSETDKTETGTVGDKAWKADMRSEEEIAREKWESKSSNTPAAKAFEEGTGQQKKDWGDLRWEARKRHKKLFEYNTDKEK